jgi:hypothetical protein
LCTFVAGVGTIGFAPARSAAEEPLKAAAAQLTPKVKEYLAAFGAAIASGLAASKGQLRGIVEKSVLGPALSWAAERALPPGAEGFKMLRRFFDQRVRGSDAIGRRLGAYTQALEALDRRAAPAFKAAAKKLDGLLGAIERFDAKKALERLETIAKKRVQHFLRARLPGVLEQGMALLEAPVRKALGAVEQKARDVPYVGDLLVGVASDKVVDALRSLRDEAMKYALSRVEDLANRTVAAIFQAARSPTAKGSSFMQPLVTVVRGFVSQAQDYAGKFQAEFQEVKKGIDTLGLVFEPKKLRAEVRAREAERVVRAVVGEANAGPGMPPGQARALAQARAALERARRDAGQRMAAAAVGAMRTCAKAVFGRPACIQRGVADAKKKADAVVAQAAARLASIAKSSMSKVQPASALAKAFAKGGATVGAGAKGRKDEAKRAEKESQALRTAPPVHSVVPKNAAAVVASLGAKARALTRIVVPKGAPSAPTVRVRPKSGADGVRAAMRALFAFLTQDWRAGLGAGRALLKTPPARLGAPITKAFRNHASQFRYRVHGAFRLLARARVVLFRLGRDLATAAPRVDRALSASGPRVLLPAKLNGPLSRAFEDAKNALDRMSVSGTRFLRATAEIVGPRYRRIVDRLTRWFSLRLAHAKSALEAVRGIASKAPPQAPNQKRAGLDLSRGSEGARWPYGKPIATNGAQ